jgi:hypothetical protein
MTHLGATSASWRWVREKMNQGGAGMGSFDSEGATFLMAWAVLATFLAGAFMIAWYKNKNSVASEITAGECVIKRNAFDEYEVPAPDVNQIYHTNSLDDATARAVAANPNVHTIIVRNGTYTKNWPLVDAVIRPIVDAARRLGFDISDKEAAAFNLLVLVRIDTTAKQVLALNDQKTLDKLARRAEHYYRQWRAIGN